MFAVVACSKSPPPPPPPTLAQLISDDATSVMRTTIDNFPLIAVTRSLIDPAQPCWPDLLAKVTAAYQVLLGGDAYFIVEGNLPRAEVEKCIPAVFTLGVKTRDDDGMLAVESPAGVVHAAWRGSFVVFGGRAKVVAAVGEHAATTVSRWQALAPTKPSVFAIASIDRNYTPLMGANLADWSLSVDTLTKQPLFMAGALVARYQTPADAEAARTFIREWSGRGKFPLEVSTDPEIVAAYDGFAAAIGKLQPTVAGVVLTMPFDSDQLGGPAFFEGVAAHFDKLAGKLPAKP